MDYVSRRRFLKAAGLGAAALAVGPPTPAERPPAAARPNILIIVADDMGWADVGYHGSRIKTPNIDRLARTGVELDSHYVQPMCTPTRVALLTGRYPSRFGNQAITPCNTQTLPFGTETLAAALKGAGYDTGISGKWHLGSKPRWGPRQFGFVRSYGSLAGGVGPYNHLYKKGPYSRTWHRNDKLIDERGHVTDLLGREVVKWIQAERRPWFYYVPFTAVHVPVKAPEKYVRLYAGKTYYDDPKKDESFKRYAAYASQMDDWIGRMVDALDRTGQRDNTLIVFFSDNGSFPSWRPGGLYPGKHPASPVLGSNLPLRGYKGQLYEGGIRTPACANWPGTLKPRKVTAPLHAVDWMPTLMRLIGVVPKTDLKWDGRDIWPILTGRQTNPAPRTIYWKFTRGSAVRHGHWKLISPRSGRKVELYNLAADPNETRNWAPQDPARATQLRKLLTACAKADSATRPPDAGKD